VESWKKLSRVKSVEKFPFLKKHKDVRRASNHDLPNAGEKNFTATGQEGRWESATPGRGKT